ncbi:MAG: YlmH/Sll1252 family protein [Tissierellia bacterium]|nr:YlmH/Sll1252 family protein [Tissierellia bacterium]
MVKIDRDKLLHHIHEPEDQLKMKQIIDKIEIVLRSHGQQETDFLNPHEIEMTISILNQFDTLKYQVFGGYDEAEQKIIYIYPFYIENPQCGLTIFKFDSLEGIKHPDILGSLLGLGIDRRKIGDILIGKEYTYFFVKNEIANFIQFNFNQISRESVLVKAVSTIDQIPKKRFEKKKIIASSLRLDTFIAQSYNLSRSNALDLIKREQVKVNYAKERKSSRELVEGDMVSVRKFGRIIFERIENRTKKENYVIEIKIPK